MTNNKIQTIFSDTYIFTFCNFSGGDMEDEEDEEDGAEDPIKAAKDMKKALESGGVDKMAGVGAQKAAQLGGMLGKGMGGMATKAFSLW